MQWSDVTARPSRRTLRQFAGLCLLVFGVIALMRVWRGAPGSLTIALATAGALAGVVGLIRPEAIRVVYTVWMIVAFPIGWTMSRVIVAALFFAVFTPFSIVFKAIGRDALRLRREKKASYWTPIEPAPPSEGYFGQF